MTVGEICVCVLTPTSVMRCVKDHPHHTADCQIVEVWNPLVIVVGQLRQLPHAIEHARYWRREGFQAWIEQLGEPAGTQTRVFNRAVYRPRPTEEATTDRDMAPDPTSVNRGT